jgi:glycosyltransferase involved in cell wall biosynthesis
MIVAIIPALDEEGTIAEIVRGISAYVDRVVVVDNGSSDRTASLAREAGADVVRQPERGYGAACLAGIAHARELGSRILVFLDGDGSDDPSEAPLLIEPVSSGDADLALGVRRAETIAPRAMTPPQRFGNWLAPALMRAVLGARYSDLPPFKAIRVDALERLALSDRGHGFTIELLLRAHALRLRVVERPVHCRPRAAGVSKVSGTLSGSARAAVKILTSIATHALRSRERN